MENIMRIFLVVVIALFLIATVGSVVLNDRQVTHWEYNIVETNQDNPVTLDSFGFEGWELVSVISIEKKEGWTDFRFYFKRKLQDVTK